MLTVCSNIVRLSGSTFVMDAFSTVPSAISAAKFLAEVVKLGRFYIKEIQSFNEDFSKLCLCISVAMDRTESIHRVFFGTPTLSTGESVLENLTTTPYPIFKQLRYPTQINVVAMMQQYHDVVLLKYRNLHAAYDLESPQTEPTPANHKTKKLQLSWIFGGKKRVQEMIDDCEGWNNKLSEIIQIYIFEKSVMSAGSLLPPPAKFEQLKSNNDIKLLGLNAEIDLIELSAGRDQKWENLEVFGAINFDDKSWGPLKFGTYDNHRVLGDFKVFQPEGQDYHNLAAAEPPQKILDRIRQLALLLNRQHSIRSRLLRCRGFYRDATSLSYIFILDFPRGRSYDPISLLDLLSSSQYRAKKPALERRLKLSLTLAIALFQFHAVGWVHKSFRSSNVLFFPQQQDMVLPEDLDEPWVVGFEYAREDSGFSENQTSGVVNTLRDIYRHPDRWGQPTVRFEKLHDLYSFGVTLLEIGLWQSANKLEHDGLQFITYKDRFDVQALFLQKAKDKLPFMVGTTYANVVVKCLSGEFDLTETDSSSSLEEFYRGQVRCYINKMPLFSSKLNRFSIL